MAAAIEEHYKPQGPSDRVPADPVAIAVALADKLDTLVGFWAIDEKPTGSKDPYALRRAALGVIRILVENGVRLELIDLTSLHFQSILSNIAAELRKGGETFAIGQSLVDFTGRSVDSRMVDLLSFFHDRLKVYLRDQGARHDLIDAVLASGASDRTPGVSPAPQEAQAAPAADARREADFLRREAEKRFAPLAGRNQRHGSRSAQAQIARTLLAATGWPALMRERSAAVIPISAATARQPRPSHSTFGAMRTQRPFQS